MPENQILKRKMVWMNYEYGPSSSRTRSSTGPNAHGYALEPPGHVSLDRKGVWTLAEHSTEKTFGNLYGSLGMAQARVEREIHQNTLLYPPFKLIEDARRPPLGLGMWMYSLDFGDQTLNTGGCIRTPARPRITDSQLMHEWPEQGPELESKEHSPHLRRHAWHSLVSITHNSASSIPIDPGLRFRYLRIGPLRACGCGHRWSNTGHIGAAALATMLLFIPSTMATMSGSVTVSPFFCKVGSRSQELLPGEKWSRKRGNLKCINEKIGALVENLKPFWFVLDQLLDKADNKLYNGHYNPLSSVGFELDNGYQYKYCIYITWFVSFFKTETSAVGQMFLESSRVGDRGSETTELNQTASHSSSSYRSSGTDEPKVETSDIVACKL
ncbi:hypothetical protein GGX14DRAFT_409241 [Mycena pura]|uniref:Uncharacterized protein n=1 Tax=Mycena pura TaxID=153505 RepID=A0AAD6UJI5_9AGAR|nr:hypothetical protein GGX14DRAFT_409241 [Mycena pura]